MVIIQQVALEHRCLFLFQLYCSVSSHNAMTLLIATKGFESENAVPEDYGDADCGIGQGLGRSAHRRGHGEATATPAPGRRSASRPSTRSRRGRRGWLLDARSHERYLGGPDDLDPRAGHVPGARGSSPCRENVDAGGRLLPPKELPTAAPRRQHRGDDARRVLLRLRGHRLPHPARARGCGLRAGAPLPRILVAVVARPGPPRCDRRRAGLTPDRACDRGRALRTMRR